MTVAMTRPEAKRAEILAAAAQAIAKHGFHGMSMRELARTTGRSPASFYNYFESKEELLFSVQRDAFATLLESAESVRPTLEFCLATPGVHLIDCPVDYAENDEILNRRIRELSAAI